MRDKYLMIIRILLVIFVFFSSFFGSFIYGEDFDTGNFDSNNSSFATQNFSTQNMESNIESNSDEEDFSPSDTNMDSNVDSKILHLEIATDLADLQSQTLYIGQYITINYKLMLLNNAKIVYTEFNPSLDSNKGDSKNADSKSGSVALIEEGKWQQNGDYYTNSFTFKILESNALIPSLVVHVSNDFSQDSMQTDTIELVAQSLVGNTSYCGVVASSLKVLEVSVEEHDSISNTMTLEIEASNSNLEDFLLPEVRDQEFGQGSKFSPDIARINLIARIPKGQSEVNFSYFDINKKDFVPINVNIANVPTFDEDIKEDLNPKSSFFRITNVVLLVLLAVFLIVTIVKRSYVFAFFSIALAGYLIYKIFANTYSIRTLPNARVLILPTPNSTELLTIPNPTRLEAIDKKNNFYKVNIDSKVGWISSMETNKK